MISCIVLAAGLSSRFGASKPLAQIGTRTLIETIQEKLLLTKLDEIVIVLGHQADTIIPLISKNHRVTTAINANYFLGQTSSFKCGLAKINPNTQGIMLLPVDMPVLQPDTIDELIDVFLKKSCLILIPTYQDRKGHPPIFSVTIKKELENLKNDEPLSHIIHQHEPDITKFPVADEGVVLSFNTPAELQEILRRSKIDNRK
jgi:CTP:molybdopterin cytidylyltransferase MocA